MFQRVHALYGKCNGVIRLLCALATARTPCSFDTDHSFVLGIVLDSYSGSDYAEDSLRSAYSRVQHMKAEGYCWILPPCTQTKDALLETCQGLDQLTEHHPLTTNGTSDHGRSQRSGPTTYLGSNPWHFPASTLFKSSAVMNRNPEILFRIDPRQSRETRRINSWKNKSQKYKKGGKHELRKAESSARGGGARPRQAACRETGAWVPFVNSHIPDSAFSLFFWNCSTSMKF